MFRIRVAVWLACVAVGLVSGCGGAADTEQARYRVVATTGMIADLVRAVADPEAEVIGLIGEGIDPHLYNPTRSDVAQLQGADLIFYNGLMLEGKMTDVLERMARSGKAVYAVTDLMDRAYLLAGEDAGYWDPHVWMDVEAWQQALAVVTEAFVAFDGERADEYRARAATYQAQLRELDEYTQAVIATIPERNRLLITAHDAFNYFGRAYDIEVQGIQGLSTESEAGLQDINRLVDVLVEREVRAVFVETSVAEKNVRALIEGAENRGHQVIVGGALFSDAMGAPGTYRGTYIGMIDHNATTIVTALGGEAPLTGLHGKLE